MNSINSSSGRISALLSIMEISDIFKNASPISDRRLPFIDEETFSLLMLINPAILTCGISILGIGANIGNIIVFAKLGFKETTNISLTALAVTDLSSLLGLLWMTLSFNPSFCNLVCEHIDLRFYEDAVVGYQRSYFTTVGGCITSLVAFERCLCVLRPLQVRLILTKSRLIIIIPSLFIFCFIPYGLVFYTTGVMLISYQGGSNASIIDDRSDNFVMYEISQIAYVMVTVLNMSTYVIVSILTALIVWKLTSQSKWRAGQTYADATGQASSDGRHDVKKNASDKDRRATMTVTVIAVMYVISFLPGTVLYIAMTFSMEFNKGMLYTNLYDFLWYVAYVGEGICASANILVYLKTSTKFREAFRTTLLCWLPANTSKPKGVTNSNTLAAT